MLGQLTSKESIIDKETMADPIEIVTSLDVEIQSLEKGTNINSININNHEDTNLVEVRIWSDVKVQKIANPNTLTNKKTVINRATQV